MSVPTVVLENGQWITRWLDPYQLLAQNRAQQEQKAAPVIEATTAPSLAILTQTLVRSPVVKWIFPARIRHQKKNDIIFISEDCVQIKEAHRDYALDFVTMKTDFDAPIRSSRIFGLPRKPTEPQSIIKAENKEVWQDDVKETSIEEENYDEDMDCYDGTDTSRIKEGASQSKAFHLPPQMLILVLESAQVVFLYAVSGPSNCVHLEASQKPLPSSISRLYQLGEHLAVDPRLVSSHNEMQWLTQQLDLELLLSERMKPTSTCML